MSTVPTPPRRLPTMKALCGALVVLACVIIAVRWSEVVAGLSLGVAVLAWLAPRVPRG